MNISTTDYTIKRLYGRDYVLKAMIEPRDKESGYKQPNFMGTGLCLDGVLRKGETISEYEDRKAFGRSAAERANETITQSLISKRVIAVPKELLYEFICDDEYLSKAKPATRLKVCNAMFRILSKLQNDDYKKRHR